MFALMSVRSTPLLIGLCSPTLFVTSLLQAQSKSPDALLPPHTSSGATAAYFPSPDRLYEARLTGGDAVPRFLSLYQVTGRHQHSIRIRVAGVQNFVWVPRRPHTLVVAAYGSADNESPAQLSLWSGGRKLHELVPLKRQEISGTDIRELEGFDIDGVTPDGKALVYDFLNADGGGPINVRLRLPTP